MNKRVTTGENMDYDPNAPPRPVITLGKHDNGRHGRDHHPKKQGSQIKRVTRPRGIDYNPLPRIAKASGKNDIGGYTRENQGNQIYKIAPNRGIDYNPTSKSAHTGGRHGMEKHRNNQGNQISTVAPNQGIDYNPTVLPSPVNTSVKNDGSRHVKKHPRNK